MYQFKILQFPQIPWRGSEGGVHTPKNVSCLVAPLWKFQYCLTWTLTKSVKYYFVWALWKCQNCFMWTLKLSHYCFLSLAYLWTCLKQKSYIGIREKVFLKWSFLILNTIFQSRFSAYCLISVSKNYSTKGLRFHHTTATDYF